MNCKSHFFLLPAVPVDSQDLSVCFLMMRCVWFEVRQLHREFLRAGANVMQTFTFYASDDKLENRGNKVTYTVSRDGPLGWSCWRGF